MPSFLQSINMFHNEQFWRLKGEKQVSHKCGGVLTLVVFVILGAIVLYQMVLIVDRGTIETVATSQIKFTAPFLNLTTYQDDPNMQPYMAAIALIRYDSKQVISSSDYNVSASYAIMDYNVTTSTYQRVFKPVNMESCTPNHFSRLENIDESFQTWGINKWYCLPINTTFYIGGNFQLSNYLRIDIQCSSSKPLCNKGFNDTLQVQLLTMNTFVNPNNNTQPLISYVNRRESIFQQNFGYKNFVYLNKNILRTDISLTPFSEYTQVNALQQASFFNHESFSSPTPFTTYYLFLSGTTVTHSRSYLKILTALSFVGGLVAPFVGIISLISMMSKFGTLVYQMRFAKAFFKDKGASRFHYLNFFSHIFYNFLSFFKKEPNWKGTKRRDQLKKTVRNLLDVIYLQRRIAFLEKALGILFEKHHLKGLHLLQTTTKKQADQQYQNHRLRKKVTDYLEKKPSSTFNSRKSLQIYLSPSKDSHFVGCRASSSAGLQHQDFQKPTTFQKQSTEINKHICDQVILIKSSNRGSIEKRFEDHQEQEDYNDGAMTGNAMVRGSKLDQVIWDQNIQQKKDFRDQYDKQHEESEEQDRKQAKKAIAQLKNLFNEAYDPQGDWRSKKILKLLDSSLRKKIQKEYYQSLQNPRRK